MLTRQAPGRQGPQRGAVDISEATNSRTQSTQGTQVPHNDFMADDEIERLLREVAGTTAGKPARQDQPKEVDRGSTGGTGGRLAFAGISAAAMGVLGWGVGLILPFVGAGSAGVGAACGAFVTALVAGPPRWFSS